MSDDFSSVLEKIEEYLGMLDDFPQPQGVRSRIASTVVELTGGDGGKAADFCEWLTEQANRWIGPAWLRQMYRDFCGAPPVGAAYEDWQRQGPPPPPACSRCRDTGVREEAGVHVACDCPIGQHLPDGFLEACNRSIGKPPKLKPQPRPEKPLPQPDSLDDIRRKAELRKQMETVLEERRRAREAKRENLLQSLREQTKSETVH